MNLHVKSLDIETTSQTVDAPVNFPTRMKKKTFRPAWAMEIVFAGTAAALWIIFYHRLVPLKLPEHLKQGERYKSKHGPVYKF